MRKQVVGGLFATLIFGGWFNAAQADWPEFRGPNQNGSVSVDGLPTRWSEKENVQWFTPIEGLGWSSPVVVGDRVFLTTSIAVDGEPGALQGAQQLALLCLSATDGQVIFKQVVFEQPSDSPSIHKKNSHASPSVIARDGRVYVHFGHQGTACLSYRGDRLWENRDHMYPPTHGNGGSPILVGDKLIVTCDGGDEPYTLALDAATGKEIWRCNRTRKVDRPFSFSTPQYIEVQGKGQIISPGSGLVQSIDPSDGKVLWSAEYEGFSLICRPLYYRGLVYICTGYMSPKLLAIDPSGRGDVTSTHVRWTVSSSVPNTPSLIAYEDQIIMVNDSGIASAVHWETGSQIWRKRIGGNYSASPTINGNLVFFQSESGESIVYRLGESPEEIQRNTLPGRIFASYGVVDRDWLIRTEHGLYRIGTP